MGIHVGIDTGGTFTDLVAIDGDYNVLHTSKEPSNPANPMAPLQAVLRQSEVELGRVARTVLGTTVATNAILERRGARVLFLTTHGFEDVLFLQRNNRPRNYDLRWRKPRPLVSRRHCLGVRERLDYRGRVLEPLSDDELVRVGDEIAGILDRDAIDALAICLLFSYVNPTHEARLGRYLQSRFPALPQSVSHLLVPIWREYERSSTVVADAFVKPLIGRYVVHARDALESVGTAGARCLMKSNGGMALLDAAPERPVETLLSGPAAGVIAGNFFGHLLGQTSVITLDMGGTSADVGLVVDGRPRYTTGFEIEWGLPVSVPVIDVMTIGAGGGSVAWVDKGGFLRVGPESAGADPGPAAYGRGGERATVTDADLLLGRLNPRYFLGGRKLLYPDRAEAAIARLGEVLRMPMAPCAGAIVRIVNDNMANAIRLLTIERGIDPREFTLVAFGGAGPLHASSLARALQIPRVVIPVHPGLCSAFGTIIADVRVDKVSTQILRSDDTPVDDVRSKFRTMIDDACGELRRQGFHGSPQLVLSVSMRYLEQNYEEDIPVPSSDLTESDLQDVYARFHEHHRRFYGYAFPEETVEIVHFKVSAIGAVPAPKLPRLAPKPGGPRPTVRAVVLDNGDKVECLIFRRDELPPSFQAPGPAIVEEIDSTIFIEPDSAFLVDDFGNIFVTLEDVK